MKLSIKAFGILLLSLIIGGSVYAQNRNDIQYYTPPTQEGVNVFESPFTTDVEFDGFKVRVGGANTLQFQAISNENAGRWQTGIQRDEDGNPVLDNNGNTIPVYETLPELSNNFNLATSNLDLDVALAPGMRMHLRTYLSSQHHTETYVKGGYLQIDSFDFIEEGFLSGLSDYIRIKVGHMENNYGDNHFRRSDNGSTMLNPFVGNYIMDSFTTEVGGEVYVYNGPLFGMVGLTNGKLNQSTVKGAIDTKPSFLAKVGYDSQVNEDLRVRLTGSVFMVSQNSSIYLYAGDRAGSRYYNVMQAGDFRAGRFSPTFTPGRGSAPAAGEMTSIMINPFVKFQGLEFYGVFETVSGKIETESASRSFTQLGAELLYRFGSEEDFYVGGRYNAVSGEHISDGDIDISRINVGGGWFMTENVMTKLEYVTQSYDGFSDRLDEGKFSGIVLEAVISF